MLSIDRVYHWVIINNQKNRGLRDAKDIYSFSEHSVYHVLNIVDRFRNIPLNLSIFIKLVYNEFTHEISF